VARIQARYIIAGVSIIPIIGALYLQFIYDVPDSQEVINMWVSLGLILMGAIGLIVSLLLKNARNPLDSDR
jgi:hypothetical protein